MSSQECLDLANLKARLVDLLDRPLSPSEEELIADLVRQHGAVPAINLPRIVAWFEHVVSLPAAARIVVRELGRALTREEYARLAFKFPKGVPQGMLADAVAFIKRPRPDLRLVK